MMCIGVNCTSEARARVRWSATKLLNFCGPCGLNAMNVAAAIGLQLALEPIHASGVCRVCGCTNDKACLLEPGTNELVDIAEGDTLSEAKLATCYWIEPDLCSGCVQGAPPPMLVDGNGRPLRGAP